MYGPKNGPVFLGVWADKCFLVLVNFFFVILVVPFRFRWYKWEKIADGIIRGDTMSMEIAIS